MARFSRITFAALGLLCLTLALSLGGCVFVNDVHEAWGEAKPEQALVGQWIQQNTHNDAERSRLTFKRDKAHHALRLMIRKLGEQPKPQAKSHPALVRTLRVGGHRFLIVLIHPGVVKESPGGKAWPGVTQRYTWDKHTLVFFNLKPAVLKRAIDAGKVAGTADALAKLDDKTLKWLSDTADDAEAWSPAARFDHAVGQPGQGGQ